MKIIFVEILCLILSGSGTGTEAFSKSEPEPQLIIRVLFHNSDQFLPLPLAHSKVHGVKQCCGSGSGILDPVPF
jgi:hypothetical protein